MTHAEWKKSRIEIEATIRDLKAKRTESRQPRWGWREARDLAGAKVTATGLYALRAHMRRRLHDPRRWPTLEEQGAMLTDRGLLTAPAPTQLTEAQASA